VSKDYYIYEIGKDFSYLWHDLKIRASASNPASINFKQGWYRTKEEAEETIQRFLDKQSKNKKSITDYVIWSLFFIALLYSLYIMTTLHISDFKIDKVDLELKYTAIDYLNNKKPANVIMDNENIYMYTLSSQDTLIVFIYKLKEE